MAKPTAPRTINTNFDPTDLPKWAQKDLKVVARCKRDPAYRRDVYNAKTPVMRNLARRLAQSTERE